MTGRRSVALLNNFAGPSLGGGEIHLLVLLRELPGRGIDPVVVCAAGSVLAGAVAEIGGVQVVPVDFSALSLLRVPSALRSRLRGVDIVQGTGFLTNIVARRLGRRLRAKVLNTVQVVPGAARLDGESVPKRMLRAGLDRFTRGRVDLFVAVSSAVEGGLRAAGVAADRIVIVPNGLDVVALRSAAVLPLPAPLGAGHPRIGFVGRLERVKGIEYFVRAVPGILRGHPEARFVVAGSGSLEAAMKTLAASLGVADHLELLGYVSPVAPVLAALDVVVIPSLSEAAGLTAIEALSLGVAVVATRVGGLPDVIVDGETGLLVPPADPEALAHAVEALLRDPVRGREMAAAGAHRVEESYTVSRMVDGYLDVYTRLVPERPHEAPIR